MCKIVISVRYNTPFCWKKPSKFSLERKKLLFFKQGMEKKKIKAIKKAIVKKYDCFFAYLCI